MFREMSQLAGILRQAQGLSQRIRDVQQRLAEMRCVGMSGDGRVTVELTGQGTAVSCHIDPSLLTPAEKDRLASLLVDAINDAQTQVRQLAAQQTAELTDAANMGDLLSMLGGKGSSTP